MPSNRLQVFSPRAILLPNAPKEGSPTVLFSWFDGFEHQRLAATTAETHESRVGGALDTAFSHSGSYSYKVTAANEVVGTDLVSSMVFATGFYFRLNTLPAAGSMNVETTRGIATNIIVQVTSVGVLRVTIGANNQAYSGTFSLNTDYWIATLRKTDGTIWTCDWWVATLGSQLVQQAQVSLTGQVATAMTGIRWGNDGANACIGWFDDLCLSAQGFDAPIQEYSSAILVPDSIGTHSLGSGLFQKTGAVAIDGTDSNSYLEIDEIPPDTTTYVAQTAIDTAAYVEYGFQNTAFPPIAVNLICFFQGSAANPYTFQVQLNDSGDISVDETTSSTTKSATTFRSSIDTNGLRVGGGVWTGTTVDGLKFRFGFSSDVTPNPQLSAVYAEYIYKTPSGVPYTDSDTVLLSLTPSADEVYTQFNELRPPFVLLQATKRAVTF